MIEIKINRDKFKFDYLPDYARYLVENKLTEFVTVGIRFCREADLPLLRPLSKLPEQELIALSIESNRIFLTAVANQTIPDLIEENARKWIDNTIGIVDREDVTAEDLILGFYLRRKILAFFLDAYTKNVVLQKFIIAEIDVFTTQEELVTLNVYLQMQKQVIEKIKRK